MQSEHSWQTKTQGGISHTHGSCAFKQFPTSKDIPETHCLLKLKLNLILKELASEMREEKNVRHTNDK